MRITLLTLSGLALVLFACSSEAPSGSVKGGSTPAAGDKDNDDDNDGNSQGTRSGTTSGDTQQTTDSTQPTSGGQCASQAKAQACFDCCDPSKGAVFEAADKALGDCVCAAAKCGTQCAQSFCNAANPSEPQQGDACDSCLAQHYDACNQAASVICDGDANCKKASECIEAAKCYDKPE
jgi:hypothetical protein